MTSALKHVYLDQNKWIDLSKYRAGRNDGARFAETFDVLKYGVEAGLVSCPLSAQHYMETAQRRDPESRHGLAQVMAELSRFDAMAPPRMIVPMELDFALRSRYGRPMDPRIVPVFGSGVRHAFAWDRPLYELPAEAAIDEPQRTALEQRLQQVLEYAALAGPPDGPFVSDEMRLLFDEFARKYVHGEELLAQGLSHEKNRREATPRFTVASEFVDILEPLNEAFARAVLSPAETTDLDSAEGVTALLMDLPSRSVVSELRAARHANPQTRFEGNDLEDLNALGIAIAYCDVVVTERQWVHLARTAGLDQRFETELVADLAAVPQRLV